MVWTIKYTESSVRQLQKFDKFLARQIVDFLNERVAVVEDPRSFGKKLVGPKLGAYWRYRVGDVRVICDIQDQCVTILVIKLGHRRDVYRN